MSDLQGTLGISASGMAAQAARMRVVSENLANADTPGYRRKMMAFQEMMVAGSEGVRAGPMRLSQADLKEIYDPANPLAGPDGTYEGSNVNMIIEIADAREAQRSYEANLRMFDQARRMGSELLELLRR
ncbi:MAG: flagellar basal body rod protein FlgC [Pseudomonadota bacterium]